MSTKLKYIYIFILKVIIIYFFYILNSLHLEISSSALWLQIKLITDKFIDTLGTLVKSVLLYIFIYCKHYCWIWHLHNLNQLHSINM